MIIRDNNWYHLCNVMLTEKKEQIKSLEKQLFSAKRDLQVLQDTYNIVSQQDIEFQTPQKNSNLDFDESFKCINGHGLMPVIIKDHTRQLKCHICRFTRHQTDLPSNTTTQMYLSGKAFCANCNALIEHDTTNYSWNGYIVCKHCHDSIK